MPNNSDPQYGQTDCKNQSYNVHHNDRAIGTIRYPEGPHKLAERRELVHRRRLLAILALLAVLAVRSQAAVVVGLVGSDAVAPPESLRAARTAREPDAVSLLRDASRVAPAVVSARDAGAVRARRRVAAANLAAHPAVVRVVRRVGARRTAVTRAELLSGLAALTRHALLGSHRATYAGSRGAHH